MTTNEAKAKKILALLQVKFTKQINGERFKTLRTQTSWGTKTMEGAVASIIRILEQ
ncbi:hypothetical protein KAR91_66810 [Candidatus Pacearchaeota archaeon]|nr:hypothetical protein [Candidatus Pacearchaeota archaeon]